MKFNIIFPIIFFLCVALTLSRNDIVNMLRCKPEINSLSQKLQINILLNPAVKQEKMF